MNTQDQILTVESLFEYDVHFFKVPASERECDWWIRTLNELAEQRWEIDQNLRLEDGYVFIIFKRHRLSHG